MSSNPTTAVNVEGVTVVVAEGLIHAGAVDLVWSYGGGSGQGGGGGGRWEKEGNEERSQGERRVGCDGQLKRWAGKCSSTLHSLMPALSVIFASIKLWTLLVVQLHAGQDQSRDSDSASEYERNPAHKARPSSYCNVLGREIYGEREKKQQ